MRQYKLALVLKEALAKKEAELKKYLSYLLAAAKGKVIKTETLGARQLAYPISGLTAASYVFLTTELDESMTVSLEKALKTDDQIIRYLLVRI